MTVEAAKRDIQTHSCVLGIVDQCMCISPTFPRSAVRAWAKQTRIKEITAIHLIEMKGGHIFDDGLEVNT